MEVVADLNMELGEDFVEVDSKVEEHNLVEVDSHLVEGDNFVEQGCWGTGSRLEEHIGLADFEEGLQDRVGMAQDRRLLEWVVRLEEGYHILKQKKICKTEKKLYMNEKLTKPIALFEIYA